MTARDDPRAWFAGAGLTAAVLLLLGWFLLVGPRLDSASEHRAATADAATSAEVLQARVAALQADAAELPTVATELAAAREELPVTSGLAALTEQLSARAATAGTVVTALAVGAPQAVVDASTTTAVTDASTAAAPTGAGTTATTGPAGQLYALPITLTSTGDLDAQVALLDAVRADGPRAVLVTSVQVGPDSATTTATAGGTTTGTAAGDLSDATTMTTQFTVFVAPQTAEDAAALADQLALAG